MVSVRVKFRPSTVSGREGTLYFRVIHDRVAKQINTAYSLFPYEWDGASAEIIHPTDNSARRVHLMDIRQRLNDDLCRMDGIIKELDSRNQPYTADDVIRVFRENKQQYRSPDDMLFPFMESVIEYLKALGKERTSETYTAALRSFKQFRQGEDIAMCEITSELMQLYEAHLKAKGDSPNTTSFYNRILRAVYNRAVEKGLVTNQCPFKLVYTGVAKTVKRALPLEVISKIKNLDLSMNPKLEMARDAFMLGFYFRGMAFVDMCYLKKKDISNGYLGYRRRKTAQQLFIRLERPMLEIIGRYETKDSIYLLPFINPLLGNERKQYIKAAGTVNRHLDTIGRMLKLSVPLRFYTARHCWASAAKCKKVPVSVISEGMGHESEKTTQIYLASLDTSEIDKANRLIIKSV